MTRPRPVPCPKCGKPWFRWAGTALECHARCHFEPAVQDALLGRYDADPRLTLVKLAAEVGVTVAVLKAMLAAASERQGRVFRGVS